MKKQIELEIFPNNIDNRDFIKTLAAKKLDVNPKEISAIIPIRRSIDARKRPLYKVLVEVYVNQQPRELNTSIEYKPVSGSKKAIIVGFGPGGMYAALRLIEWGIKPIIIERGKNVRDRRFDLKAIQQDHIVNPDSNYCFGEGGAGTYSDGKLYTRSTKRGDVDKTLNILVQHGADPDILIDSHPHIGSNNLPKVVTAIRETILKCGGEIHFESKVTDLLLTDYKIKGVVVNGEKEFLADSVILATGHSAKDIYRLLHKKDILIEQKPFAMGVRIEHPQALINEIQYHSKDYDVRLPAASYNLACEIGNRGVYSFCMCPGGIIVPSATAPGEQVVNGMSISRRDSPFANAGFVVSVDEGDWKQYKSAAPFAGLKLQEEVEKLAFELGGNSQTAPAQKLTDFVEGKLSTSLNPTSYIPGIVSAPLHERYPKFMVKGLREALKVFGNKMKGYYTEEAQLIGAETRTSSPIRIPRDKKTLMHVQVAGLFPCGEGAGYAGGIVSAAIDGENCANGVAGFLNKK
ncbi:MAG: FAD-binding protein [Bacteroidetes bacterium]|nr:FAD-binding protein [Bacteroidota bacterium]